MNWLSKLYARFGSRRPKPGRLRVACSACGKVVTQRVTGDLYKHNCVNLEEQEIQKMVDALTEPEVNQ
jgi:hypothetical protein